MTDHGIAVLLRRLTDDIRSAHIGRLQEISPALEAALPELSALDRDTLMAVGRQADEALRLLSAMMHGVRSAQRRLAEIAAAERAMTYDRSGAKTGLTASRRGQRV